MTTFPLVAGPAKSRRVSFWKCTRTLGLQRRQPSARARAVVRLVQARWRKNNVQVCDPQFSVRLSFVLGVVLKLMRILLRRMFFFPSLQGTALLGPLTANLY